MCIEVGDLLDLRFHAMACAKLDEEPDFSLVTSWIELRGPGSNRRVIAPVNQIDADTCDLDAVIGNTDAIHSATVFRRDAWTAADGFDESLPVLEDWDVWIRLSRRPAPDRQRESSTA